MTIRFIKQWNGHSPDEVNSSLGSSEESRLVLLGYASYDLDGANDGTESLVKAKTNPLTGGSVFPLPFDMLKQRNDVSALLPRSSLGVRPDSLSTLNAQDAW